MMQNGIVTVTNGTTHEARITNQTYWTLTYTHFLELGMILQIFDDCIHFLELGSFKSSMIVMITF
jgi:hypothetical protein